MTQQDEFSQPQSGGGYFESKNAVGHLVLITKVHEVYHNPTNTYGGKPQPRDEAKVDIVDLDAAGQEHRERVIITHPGLVNRLATGASNILGRIGQVPTDNGNPAYVLNGHEPTDVPRAQQWVQMWRQLQAQGIAMNQGAQAPAQAPQTAPVAQQAPAAVPVAQSPAQAPQVPQPALTPEQLQALMALQAQQTGQQGFPQNQGNPPF